MKLPFKPSLLKTRHTKPIWLVIHHTVCQYANTASAIDSPKYQYGDIVNNAIASKQPELNYHYVIDKIKEDYQVITARPFVFECDYPDIPEFKNKKALHVAFMGNYDLKIPEARLYEVAAYKVITPLMKIFSISPNKLVTHAEISDDEDQSCPGDFFDMDRLITQARRFLVK